MKVYISADIEGVTGIVHRDETLITEKAYETFQEQMTREVIAACEGAIAGGAQEVIVKDAHHTGRNIDPSRLPSPVKLIRGWSGHPYSMVQELDSSFAALVLIGYHSQAGSGGNPLAHTLSGKSSHILLNGKSIAEFHLVAMTAAYEGVPVVFVSGDAALSSEVKIYNSAIETVATNKGIGESVLAVNPHDALYEIQLGVQKGLKNRQQIPIHPLDENFKLEIEYKQPPIAYQKSFYPGAQLQNERLVVFETDNWFEVMRILQFIVLS